MDEFGRQSPRNHVGKRGQVCSERVFAGGVSSHQRFELPDTAVSLLESLLERRLGPGDLGQGQPQIERWTKATLESGSDALGRNPKALQSRFGQVELPLCFDRPKPNLGHLAAQRQSGRRQVGEANPGVGEGRVLAGSNPAPQVRLPAGVHSQAVVRGGRTENVALAPGYRETDEILALLAPVYSHVRVGQQRSSGDDGIRTSCLDSRGRRQQVVIALESLFDETFQLRVAEIRPPVRPGRYGSQFPTAPLIRRNHPECMLGRRQVPGATRQHHGTQQDNGSGPTFHACSLADGTSTSSLPSVSRAGAFIPAAMK